MDPTLQNFEKTSGNVLLGSSPEYRDRAIQFAHGILAAARAFPATRDPLIPSKDVDALLASVHAAVQFLIDEKILTPLGPSGMVD